MGDRPTTTYHLETLAANRALQEKLQEKQVEIQGLWRTIARAYDLWNREQLENRRLRMQIKRLEKKLEELDPNTTPPCSRPRTPTPPIADL